MSSSNRNSKQTTNNRHVTDELTAAMQQAEQAYPNESAGKMGRWEGVCCVLVLLVG
jgi:hypothetical protein